MPNLKPIQTKGGSKTPKYDALSDLHKTWIDNYFQCGMNLTEASRRMGYEAPMKHGYRMSLDVQIKEAISERLAENRVTADSVLFRMYERATGTATDFISFKDVQEQETEWVPGIEAIARLRENIEVEEEIADRLGLTGKDLKAVRYQVASYKRQIVRIEAKLRRDPTYQVLMDGPVRDKVQPVIDLELMRERGKMHLIKSVRYYKDGSFKVELYDAHAADVELGKYLGLFGPKGTIDDPLITEIRLVRGPGREEKEEAIMLDAEAQIMDVEEEAPESVSTRNKPVEPEK